MTCYQRNFTSFQREAITKIAALLGERRFDYTKNNNNHMQIKVEGIDRVFYTSATPSDYRAISNVLGEIRAELNRLNMPETKPEAPPHSQIKSKAKKSACELVQGQVKQLQKQFKSKLRSIRRQEFKMLIQKQDAQEHALSSTLLAESVHQYRKQLTADPLEEAVNRTRGSLFVPPGLLRQGKNELEGFLNSHLASLADYRTRLEQRYHRDADNEQPLDTPLTEDHEKVKSKHKSKQTSKKNRQNKRPISVEPVAKGSAPVSQCSSLPSQADATVPHDINPEVLLTGKASQRIKTLKALSKLQIRQLMEDCQQALHQKHQDDIAFVVQEMQQRGVALQELESAMG